MLHSTLTFSLAALDLELRCSHISVAPHSGLWFLDLICSFLDPKLVIRALVLVVSKYELKSPRVDSVQLFYPLA